MEFCDSLIFTTLIKDSLLLLASTLPEVHYMHFTNMKQYREVGHQELRHIYLTVAYKLMYLFW